MGRISKLFPIGIMLLGGCASVPVPAAKVITVTQTQYIAIPPYLLAPCPLADASAVHTNQDLLNAFLADRQALLLCNTQLKSIQGLGGKS